MLSIFKSSFPMYLLCATLLGIPAVFFISETLMTHSFFEFIGAVLLFIILLAALVIVLAKIINKRYKKYIAILHDTCDPLAFIQVYAAATKKTNALNQINICTAHLYAGNYDQAATLQQSIDSSIQSNRKIRKQYSYNYYLSHFIYFMRKSELNNAAQALAVMQSLVQNKQVPAGQQANYLLTNITKQLELQIANGDYSNTLTFFKIRAQQEIVRIRKVDYTYTLANIYLHNQDFENARACLDFVVQNGNTTIFVPQAQALLQQLP